MSRFVENFCSRGAGVGATRQRALKLQYTPPYVSDNVALLPLSGFFSFSVLSSVSTAVRCFCEIVLSLERIAHLHRDLFCMPLSCTPADVAVDSTCAKRKIRSVLLIPDPARGHVSSGVVFPAPTDRSLQ